MNDDDLRRLLRAVGDVPSERFRAELRATLAAPAGEPPSRHRAMPVLAIAAVVLTIVVGLLAIDRVRIATNGSSRQLAEAITGRTWVSIDPYSIGVPQFTVSGRPDELAVDGNSGCNDFRGPFRLSAAGEIVASEIMTTLVDCGEPPGSSLSGLVRLRLDGEILTASTEAGSTRFRSLESMPVISSSAELPTGTWWSPPNGEETMVIADDVITIGECSFAPEFHGDQLLGVPEQAGCTGSAGLVQAMIAVLQTEGLVLRTDGTSLFVGIGTGLFRLDGRPLADDVVLFSQGLAFGYQPGLAAHVAVVSQDVSERLGPIDHDTGWYDDPGTTALPDCSGGRSIRTLWWKDFSITLRHAADPADDGNAWIASWTVGEQDVAGPSARSSPYTPPADAASGILTDSGIGIGTPEATLVERYGSDSFGDDGTGLTIWDVDAPTNYPVAFALRFGVRDGTVSGYSATAEVCEPGLA